MKKKELLSNLLGVWVEFHQSTLGIDLVAFSEPNVEFDKKFTKIVAEKTEKAGAVGQILEVYDDMFKVNYLRKPKTSFDNDLQCVKYICSGQIKSIRLLKNE